MKIADALGLWTCTPWGPSIFTLGATVSTVNPVWSGWPVFPAASIAWETDLKRQAIVDSWPEDVDDQAARRDWGFAPVYDFQRAFDEYLIPSIRERYR